MQTQRYTLQGMWAVLLLIEIGLDPLAGTQERMIKRYKESDRKDVERFAKNLGKEMSLPNLCFWLGLGILLIHGYTLKATHDKLTAYPPGEEKLPRWDRLALRKCGWLREDDQEPVAWVSFYVGG
jgi:hypothetical protein